MSTQVAVVTGAGRGLGEAIAKDLARAGARLVLAGRSVGDLESVRESIDAEGGSAIVQPTDVTDADSVARLFEAAASTFGRSTCW